MALLRFTPEFNKKRGPRVAVKRIDQATGKIKMQIGSFSARKEPRDLLPKLTPGERYEFEEFLAALDFSKLFFNCDVDEQDRMILKVAPQFKQALFELWEKAKTHNIEFNPAQEMLYTLFNRAKKLEAQLQQIDLNNNPLTELGIDITKVSTPQYKSRGGELLFRKLLELDSAENIADQFNMLVKKRYGRNTTFKAHYFKLYAGLEASNKRIPTWYYGAALELLLEYNTNPLLIISLAECTEYWLAANRTLFLTAKKAINAFNKQLDLSSKQLEQSSQFIQAAYSQKTSFKNPV